MTILYLINYAGQAGTEKYVLELMCAFDSRGHDCRLAFGEAGPLSETAAREGFGLLQVDLSLRKLPGTARTLSRYCRDNGVDVIHAQYPRENTAAVLSRIWRPVTRVVYTSHLTLPPDPKWKIVNRIITPGDAAVIAVCRAGADLLVKNGISPSLIRVIPNGIQSGAPYPKQDVIRREYGLEEDCFVFITLARYGPEKGLDVLLQAVSRLRERTGQSFVCLVAGEGELYEEIGSEIAALDLQGQVIRAGFRKDTAALLCSADAYVSPSVRAEAMSISVLEAMRCSLPLAVTDVGAGRELAEGCGFAVPPGDPEALSDAMLFLLEKKKERESFGKRAYEKAVSEYIIYTCVYMHRHTPARTHTLCFLAPPII